MFPSRNVGRESQNGHRRIFPNSGRTLSENCLRRTNTRPSTMSGVVWRSQPRTLVPQSIDPRRCRPLMMQWLRTHRFVSIAEQLTGCCQWLPLTTRQGNQPFGESPSHGHESTAFDKTVKDGFSLMKPTWNVIVAALRSASSKIPVIRAL